MKNTQHIEKAQPRIINKRRLLALAMVPTLLSSAWAAPVLQGQNKASPNTWITGNLQGWLELDYIPMRVYFPAGMSGAQTVRVDFPHLNAKTFGFEDLTGFTAYSPNVKFTSNPKLTTNPSGTWSYAFSVNLTDAKGAEVRFLARLASGAHLYGGSSLQINSSAGNLRIHKPGPAPGLPNLAIVQTGPANAPAGTPVTYTILYTNKATGYTATGAQVSQIVDPQLLIDLSSLGTNAHVVGNTVFWDLGNLAPGASGQIVLQTSVNFSATLGSVLTTVAQINSSQNDLDMQDNASTVSTSVICGGAAAAILSSPSSVSTCPGESVTFSTDAAGPGKLNYQWRKDGAAIGGATSSNLTIASVAAGDVGLYDVVVSTPCDTLVSGAAVLSLRPGAPLTTVRAESQQDGSIVLNFDSTCGGNYHVEYTEDLKTWKASPQTVTGNGLSVQWRDNGAPATDSMPNTRAARYYRVFQIF